jgi:Domain of unknown function (DUF4147)
VADSPTPTLTDLGGLLTASYRGAMTDADAYRAVRAAIRVEQGTLRLGNRFVPADQYREIAFVALGNAAPSLALGAWEALGERLTQGIVAGPAPLPTSVPFRAWELPLGWPGNERGLTTVDAVDELAAGLGPRDLLLLLLSPGSMAGLSKPPAGLPGEEWSSFLRALSGAGLPGSGIAEVVRVAGLGLCGGRLGARPGAGSVETLIVDRGDGPGLVGGGPTVPVTEEEHARVRAVLAAQPEGTVPLPITRTMQDHFSAHASAAGVDRPVVLLGPPDALQGASGVLADRKWFCRLAATTITEAPEAAARRLVERAEELVRDFKGVPGARAIGAPRNDRPNGLAVLAGLTLGVPEGIDEGPAIERFLASASAVVARRGSSVALLPTAGALAKGGEGAGRSVSTGAEPLSAIPMRAGLTDVGSIAILFLPAEGAAPPSKAAT